MNKKRGGQDKQSKGARAEKKGVNNAVRTDVIYLRVPTAVKDSFNDFIEKNEQFDKGDVFTALWNYFSSTTEIAKKSIIQGTYKDPMKIFSRILVTKSWADHAYDNKRWSWALELYEELEKLSYESEDLTEYIRYKQLYCLAEIAWSLRNSAIKKDGESWEDLFKYAFVAIDKAIHMSLELKGSISSRPPHNGSTILPAVLFGLACCLSIKCVLLVENSLGSANVYIRNICSNLESSKNEDWYGQQEGEWAEIGSGWRTELAKERKLTMEINYLAKEAMAALEKLRQTIASSREQALWLVQLVESDPDLVFLRHDSGCADWFEKWKEDSQRISPIEAFRKIFADLENT